MLVESVLSSEVLPAPNEISKRLMAIACELQSKPLHPSAALIHDIRESLASVLDDLLVDFSGLEYTMRVVELFTIISKTRLLMLGKGKQSFRYTARLLQFASAEAAAFLDAAFKDALAQQDPTRLLKLGRKLLADLGGSPPQERKKMLMDYPRVPLGD